MGDVAIQYRLSFPDGRTLAYELRLDGKTLALTVPLAPPPAWTRLCFHQCRNCPLGSDANPHCPVAVNLAPLVRELGGIESYSGVQLEVTTPERTITGATSAQRAVSSLLGLVMAGSECPHTRVFRPMARYHLPLATEEETIYRAASMYLLAQYLRRQRGLAADGALSGLATIYAELQNVNAGMAERMRYASNQDAAVNAVVLLDLLAKALPYSIEDSLEDIAYLFAPYLDPGHTRS